MNCGQARLQIAALADGSLSPEEASAAQMHMADCRFCAEFYSEQVNLAEFIEGGLELDPPPRIWEQIESRIQPARRGRQLQIRSLLDLLRIPESRTVMAGLALMLLFSFSLLNLPDELDSGLLAELESYRLEVPENPFLSEVVKRVDGNPFQSDGGRK